jgi:HD-GYP domain-containing protein (c-di-GMP phosphodiesterase class II)
MSNSATVAQPSKTGANAKPAAAAGAALPDDLLPASVDELIIGRTLNSPLFDAAGVLLLAAGSTITSEMKRLLKARGQNELRIHKDDAATLSLDDLPAADENEFKFSSEIAQKLDSVFDSGLLHVKNAGPAVKDSMVIHGKKAYDMERRKELIEQHAKTGKMLDGMMRTAVFGHRVDGKQITSCAAQFLSDMTADSENAITSVFEAGDEDLSNHCLRMSVMGMAIGTDMGLDADNVRTIGVAGLVHDWGMSRVPAAIRRSPTTLTSGQFLEIQKHPIFVQTLLDKMSGMPRLVPLVAYQVHEKFNGSGYPRGRQGNAIHIFARILHVADTYVSLTSKREHRKAVMPYAAVEYLLQQARAKAVDADVVRSVLRIMSLFPIGSYVVLSNGSAARVLRANADVYTSPIVQVVQTKEGEKVDPASPEALVDLKLSDLKVVQALPTPGKEETGLSAEATAPGW